MQTETEQFDVGILVGRFQVHELTDAHEALIQHVCDQHEKVIIFLGLSPLPTTTNNPLDFEARKQMILAKFPQVNVLYVMDQFSDDVWSRKLDEQVTALVAPGQSVVLYGSRDSFIPHYTGRFDTRKLADSQLAFYSGTAVRKEIGKSATKASPDFRAGVIWASQARFPTAFTTVDIAILNEDATKVLLGRKPGESKFRFIGGFSDPRSEDFETDARREVMEEAGVEVGDVTYIGSTRVDDWRYRNEADCIKTMMFTGKLTHGRPRPGDDIEEVRWFNLPLELTDREPYADHGKLSALKQDPTEWISEKNINPGHRTLLQMLVHNQKGR